MNSRPARRRLDGFAAGGSGRRLPSLDVYGPSNRGIRIDTADEIAVNVINHYGDEVLKVHECHVESRNEDGLVTLSATDG